MVPGDCVPFNDSRIPAQAGTPSSPFPAEAGTPPSPQVAGDTLRASRLKPGLPGHHKRQAAAWLP